jgi:TonB-linked SusC/RagA family outer membrane protein
MKNPLLSAIFPQKSREYRPIFNIMRITICLLLFFTGFAFAENAYSQNARVSLNQQKAYLKDVLKEIEQQTDYLFVSNREIDLNRKVSIYAKNKPVREVLNQLFAVTDLSYVMEGVNIIITQRGLPDGQTANEQKRITGTVINAKGEPVIGASVVEKGTSNGNITDLEGKFSLNVPSGAILVISYIGYKTQEIVAGNQTVLTLTLAEDHLLLDEVIVIGYGTARRQDYTGSVSSVKLENSAISTLPNLNVLESLKGNVAGLNIGATNRAGGVPSMLIRGQNSINGDNNPLIVLDGVIYMGDIADINPNDIANIDVLKDAVSSAVYGSRAANGIIVISTKKGRSNKPVITFNASAGSQTWPNKPNMLKGTDWFSKANKLLGNPEGTTSWLVPSILDNYQAGKETDWLSEIVKTGSLQDYQIAISGAAKGLNYYLSTAYEDNQGVIRGEKFNRISIFGKINASITDWLEIGVDASFSKRDYSGVAGNISLAEQLWPYAVNHRDDEGNLERFPTESGFLNPMWGVNSSTRDNTDYRYNFRLNTYAVVSIPWVKGLNYRLNFLPNLDQIRQGNFYYEDYYITAGQGLERYTPEATQKLLPQAEGELIQDQSYSYVFDNILTYKNVFGKHSIEGTLVATRDFSKYRASKMTGSDFSESGSTTLGLDGLQNAKIQKVDMSGGTERSNIGYLGRIVYGFDGKYYLNASYRRDGASVFGDSRKWGNFAGAGAAWILTKEDFMKNIASLNNLKLKIAFGQNGNQGIQPYTTLSQVSNGSNGGIRFEFSDASSQIYYGLRQSTLGNSELGWESTNAWNFGFESAWLKNRLFVDVDFYHTETSDQIFNRTIPSMTGFSSIYTSMGQVDNDGIELTVRSVNLENRDLTWITMLTFSKNNNTLRHLYGEDVDGDGKEDDDIASSLFIGKSLGAIYGYKQIGIVQEEDAEYMTLTGASPGNPKYADLDGVPGITAADRTILGYNKENFRLNIGNTVRYKDFEFYILVNGIFGGNKHYLSSNTYAFQPSGIHHNESYEMLNRPYWTPENRNNVYPIVTFMSDGRFLGLQSRTFVRIQDVSLSYTFNAPWVKSLNIQSLKVYLAAKNIATITNWFGTDPETGGRFMDGSMPVVSTYSLGVRLSF